MSAAPAQAAASAALGPAPRIRDAEMSVDFLCRKYEVLSEQLRAEERRRGEAEGRGRRLRHELGLSEEALQRRRAEHATELSQSESAVAALRASASAAVQRAAWQAERVREEQVSAERLEDACARLVEESRAEAAKCDSALARAADQDREGFHQECENAEAARRLRRVEAERRATLEDARIAQQRLLLATHERQSWDADLDASKAAARALLQDAERLALQLPGRRRQLEELGARLEALTEAAHAVRMDTARKEGDLAALHEDERLWRARCGTVHQELAAQRHSTAVEDAQLRGEVEAVSARIAELESCEHSRADEAAELNACRYGGEQTEAALAAARRATAQAQTTSQLLGSQLGELSADEQRNAASASGLRKARHVENLAFDDVKGELQGTFRRREVLVEELTAQLRARDALAVQLRTLRPEISEADGHCSILEGQLARQASELESELVQQRRAQQEFAAAAETIRNLRRREAHLRAELDDAVLGAVGVREPRSSLAATPTTAPAATPGLAASRGGCGAIGWDWSSAPPLPTPGQAEPLALPAPAAMPPAAAPAAAAPLSSPVPQPRPRGCGRSLEGAVAGGDHDLPALRC